MKTKFFTLMNANKYPVIHKNFSHHLYFNEIWHVNEWRVSTNYLGEYLK